MLSRTKHRRMALQHTAPSRITQQHTVTQRSATRPNAPYRARSHRIAKGIAPFASEYSRLIPEGALFVSEYSETVPDHSGINIYSEEIFLHKRY